MPKAIWFTLFKCKSEYNRTGKIIKEEEKSLKKEVYIGIEQKNKNIEIEVGIDLKIEIVEIKTKKTNIKVKERRKKKSQLL